MTAPDLDALQALLKQPFRNGMPINELCADALNAITELRAEVARLNTECEMFANRCASSQQKYADRYEAILRASARNMVPEARQPEFERCERAYQATIASLYADVASARVERNIALAERHPDWSLLESAEARIAELERERDALALQVKMRPLPEVREDESLIRLNEELRAERDALRSALRKWAVSRHTNKCYICDWSWSEGAPQIHSVECLCYGGMDNDN
jgi:hypothetical protein